MSLLDVFIFLFEIVGTVAFAVSGALTGMKKNMDIFGVIILGVTTATGGGVLRDFILGISPPALFTNPVYAFVAAASAVAVFLPFMRNLLIKKRGAFELVLLIMDSLGLGIFTVVGVRTAYAANPAAAPFLAAFVGVMTGVGGGVMRDVLAGDTPYIFVKHIYACASIAGAVICILLTGISAEAAVLSGTAAVIAIRFLSAHFRWSLPHADFKINGE